MTIAHLLCSDGISSELLVASLVDAGAPIEVLQAAVDRTGLPARFIAEPDHVRTVHARRVHLEIGAHAPRFENRAALLDVVDRAGLSGRAQRRAVAIIDALVSAEAAVHGVAPSEVRLHELGRPAAIIRTVACAVALESLDVDRVTVSSIAVGDGVVDIAHGRFPLPPPAVLVLLEGFDIEGGGRRQELTSPSGAAVVSALARPVPTMPQLRLTGHGRGVVGAGDDARILTVLVGASGEHAEVSARGHEPVE